MTEFDWKALHKDANTKLEGEYPLVVTEADAGESSNGKPMIKLKLKVESGTFAGRAYSANIVVSPESSGAMKMFFINMDAFGFEAAFWDNNPNRPLHEIAQMMVNRRVIGVIGTRVWQGAEREDVKSWKRAVGGAVMGANGLGGLGGGTLGGVVSSSSTPATPPPAAVQAELSAQPSTAAPEAPF